MTLQEAYQAWQQQLEEQGNRSLYVKTRTAFQKTWFALPTNKPCSYYTRDILASALRSVTVPDEYRVRATSVMLHVLRCAHDKEPENNPAPDYTYEELLEYAAVAEAREESKVETVKVEGEEKTPSPQPEATNPKPKTGSKRKTPSSKSRTPGSKLKSKSSKPKVPSSKPQAPGPKPHGRAPRPFAQIDPTTLEIVKVWPTMRSAMREVGTANLSRSRSNVSPSAGFYWCLADEYDTYLPMIRAKLAAKATVKDFMESAEGGAQKKDGEEKPQSPKPKTNSNRKAPGSKPKASRLQAQSLQDYSDQELFDELERRGWHGEFHQVRKVIIGGS